MASASMCAVRDRLSIGRLLGHIWLLVLWVFLSTMAHADALRCGTGFVESGDPAAKVRRDCGTPTFVDRWTGGDMRGPIPTMQEWTYNRGPGQLLQIVAFRNARMRTVRTDGYGFVSGTRPERCPPEDIRRGMSKYRLLQNCGPPERRSALLVYRSRRIARDDDRRQDVFPIYRERWIYGFGPRRLRRQVTLENAFVTQIKTLERGAAKSPRRFDSGQ